MPASARSAGSLFSWLLALTLLLSVGVNVYCLTPGHYAAPGPSASATSRPASADAAKDEEQDRVWAALAEELRQTRQQLAACQGQATPATSSLGR